MGKYKQHQEKLGLIKLHLQKSIPSIRIFDRHVGMFSTISGAPIRINRPGMSDLYALLPFKYGCIHIEIEVKTGNSRLSKDQKNWKKFCEEMNIIFIEARDENEIYNQIKNGLTQLHSEGLIQI